MAAKKKPQAKFRVWDGEGKNFPDGSHRLVLLSNSDEEYIYEENGLSTLQCLRFLLQKRSKKKNVWFAFGYDVCKMLCDVPLRKREDRDYCNLETLWKRNATYYKGYKLEYFPNKIFRVSFGPGERFNSTDIFSFFQTSFLKACEQWGIDASAIEQGKADRNIFDKYTFEEILTYNFLELRYAQQLVEKLYYSFVQAGLVPSSWHGPGALANTFFKRNIPKKHWGRDTALEEMEIPIRHAYFGGRIDIAAIGEVYGHQYDLISAYPHALTDCISLDNVFWHFNPFPFVDDRHALYHIIWNIPHEIQWGPFPWRKENGTVLFPNNGEGWYWGVEVLAAEKLFPQYIQRIAAYYPLCIKHYPFKEIIETAYNKRNIVGRKTGAGKAIKLLLNSLYGKLCQSIGSASWQNYIWAGYITAVTRSRMLDAIRIVGSENVLVIATDGIFTRRKMEIKEANTLGSWEYDGDAIILLVGAGLYTLIKDSHVEVVKSRGLPGNLNHGYVLRSWGCDTILDGIGEDSDTSHYSTFIGIGKALHQEDKPFGIFMKEQKILQDVTAGGTSKRFGCISMLFAKGWQEMKLQIRQRPTNAPMLSAFYDRSRQINIEKKVENETAEEA